MVTCGDPPWLKNVPNSDLPFGKHTKFAIENGPVNIVKIYPAIKKLWKIIIEIVDLPIENGWKWWFSIFFCMFTRPGNNNDSMGISWGCHEMYPMDCQGQTLGPESFVPGGVSEGSGSLGPLTQQKSHEDWWFHMCFWLVVWNSYTKPPFMVGIFHGYVSHNQMVVYLYSLYLLGGLEHVLFWLKPPTRFPMIFKFHKWE